MKKFPFDVTSCQKDIQKTLCLIYQNIDYAGLKIEHAEDMDLVDEFVGIILDVLLSQSKTIRINGESKPRELVKRNLLKLNYFDIEHVLNQFKKRGERRQHRRETRFVRRWFPVPELFGIR